MSTTSTRSGPERKQNYIRIEHAFRAILIIAMYNDMSCHLELNPIKCTIDIFVNSLKPLVPVQRGFEIFFFFT